MHDLRDQLGDVWKNTLRLTKGVEGGRSVMFIAASSGEGTSSVAASFALLASQYAEKTAWLVDLSLRRNVAFSAFEQGFASDIGKPGRAFDASLRQDQIYTLIPEAASGAQNKLLSAHEIEGQRLLVTRFRNEHLSEEAQVQVRTSPGWWQALRKISDWAIVDAPALERSPAGLAMVSQMDAVFLVVQADRTSPEMVIRARNEIEAHGGSVSGVVMNQLRADARLFERHKP
ncbi:MAG: hypothetical protein Hens3KO_16900 [Henriciella sp.]